VGHQLALRLTPQRNLSPIKAAARREMQEELCQKKGGGGRSLMISDHRFHFAIVFHHISAHQRFSGLRPRKTLESPIKNSLNFIMTQ
jgi:hypothetical protein